MKKKIQIFFLKKQVSTTKLQIQLMIYLGKFARDFEKNMTLHKG